MARSGASMAECRRGCPPRGDRRPNAPESAAHIAGEPTTSRQAARPSPCARECSSPGPPAPEIPFNRQLANLGITLRRLSLVLLPPIPPSSRAARQKARHAAENLLLPPLHPLQ